jgi:hypothetical protein
MKRFLHYVAAFIAAVLAASVIASVFSTQMVIGHLKSIDVVVPFGTRLAMTVDDFAILSTLAPAIAACLVIAFPLAGLAWRRIGGSRWRWYIWAGFFAVIVELLIMRAVFDLMPIAGARTQVGLMSQGLAGAFGGWLFAVLTTKPGERKDA